MVSSWVRHGLALFGVVALLAGWGATVDAAEQAAKVVDLSAATIVVPKDAPVVGKAAVMLQEEIQKRTGLRLEVRTGAVTGTAIVLATADVSAPTKAAVPEKPEGYAIAVESGGTPTVYAIGHDDRGVLFAAGRLLRLMAMRKNELTLDASAQISTAPEYPIRAHQIGYRDTANSYDAWGVGEYEQYLRDLVVFGTNGIELIPSLDPKEVDGPIMKEPIWDMTIKLAKMIASYGLDVWYWMASEGSNATGEARVQALAKWDAFFQATSPVDAVFIPGGDPGNTPPDILMPWLEEMAAIMRKHHPKAQLWLSNQGFEDAENDYLFKYLEERQPDWLTGMVFGPWTHLTLEQERARTPKKYGIRRYPDITHCVRCEYPVPNWDRAFAFTLGREPFNPRPRAEAHIHNRYAPLSVGFGTYSDGINDDVNKMLWSALGWDSKAGVESILRDFGRYFVGEDEGQAVADGLFALEKNWVGPVRDNQGIESAFAQWQALEKQAPSAAESNWRFQLMLLRAYYDLYVQRRLRQDEAAETKALSALRRARETGVPEAIQAAREQLSQELDEPTRVLRQHLEELGAALNKSIGMQLDVKRYKAKNPERGAVLEFLDRPLNDKSWFEAQFKEILAMPGGPAQVKRVDAILDWENPGPGGFYDDLGNATKEPHLVRQKTWEEDPGFIESPQDEFASQEGARLSWQDVANTLYGTPLRMHYDGLDGQAAYKLRVTYAGRHHPTMRLLANDKVEIHGPLPQPSPIKQLEFDIPPEATRGGTLDLEWHRLEGRGCQVAEVWLMKK
ncbi:MAG: hypothetical protein HY706_12140 [Candidatus Hydrogenedentes bacterium]|nr:hypothetical protein [Candidatus Hydrogenedentota bacterium]